MEYTTIQKTADRWGLSKAYVYELCQAGRIPGVVYENKHWRVPVDAENPISAVPVGVRPVSKKAKEWGVPEAAVISMCKRGDIPGTVHIGRYWYIPEDAVYPLEGYIAAGQMAEKWGLHRQSVWVFCDEGRIPGAKRIGRVWYVPADAKRPADERTERNRGYLSPTKTAEKWGIARQNVCKACREGLVPGAELINGRWHIPVDAENPADRRGKTK